MTTKPYGKKLGIRTIECMLSGSGGYRKKRIKRTVWKDGRIYWFQIAGRWVNADSLHITVSKSEYNHL